MAKNDNAKLCAILSYFLAGIVWYYVDDKMKKNKFAEFHAKQALVLLITSIIINVVGMIIPIIGWFIILPIGGLLVLIWWILGLIYAATDKKTELFLIGQFAKKF